MRVYVYTNSSCLYKNVSHNNFIMEEIFHLGRFYTSRAVPYVARVERAKGWMKKKGMY